MLVFNREPPPTASQRYTSEGRVTRGPLYFPQSEGRKQKLGTRVTRPSESSDAFTLVELLVVIAIIAILASLLLPSLSKAKSAALGTECRVNLRDVGLGMRMYLDEFESYPTASGAWLVGADSAYGVLTMSDWKEALLPYIGLASSPGERIAIDKYANMRKLRCPLIIRKPDGAKGNSQYAYNASGTGPLYSAANLGLGGFTDEGFKPTAESKLIAPASMIAVGDVEPGMTTTLPPGFPVRKTFMGASVFDVCSTNRISWPGAVHSGQANMLFCDGHVESGRQTNWVSSSASARARWNNDHEPHPETWERH